jgi:hypothetical protein
MNRKFDASVKSRKRPFVISNEVRNPGFPIGRKTPRQPV